MQTLANVTERTWKQIDGIQTFSRIVAANPPDHYENNVVKILEWTKSLAPDQRKLLLSGWLRLEQTPPDIHKSLLDLSDVVMPNTAFYFLNTNTRFSFSLEFVPRIAYIDPKTGHQFFVNLQLDSDSQKPTFEISVPRIESLEKPDTGSLDFGDGMILSARQLLEKAATVFKKRSVIDGRITQSNYFVSGHLTQQAFEKAMQTMLTVAPVQTRLIQEHKQNANTPQAASRSLYDDLRQKEWKDLENQQVDTTWLRSKNWMRDIAIGATDGAEIRRRQEVAETQLANLAEEYGATEQLPLKDFLEHKKTTVAALSIGRPGLAAELKKAGLSSDTPVTLQPGMALKLEVNNKQHNTFILQLLSGDTK